MQAPRYKSICTCPHEKTAISEVNSKISLCFKCSSVIYKNDSGQKISTIKPSKYSVTQETATPLFLSIPDNHTPYNFRNKSDFQKIRISIVKKMKNFCSFFNLSKKTYFLSLDYFDRICSKMLGFELQDLLQISQLAIILASKFHEPQNKTREIKVYLGLTNTYSQDELFLLRLLDYDLYAHTSYDILIDIMHTGFLFNDEKFSKKKMNFLYGKMENILYFFSETKLYIEMTNKEFALAIVGLIRETLGLIAYNDIIKNTFMSQDTDIQNYYSCLNKLRKCFKILDDSNHSDSNTDENSDNNSDNSENSSDKNQKNEK
jgi:hypothetical protein